MAEPNTIGRPKIDFIKKFSNLFIYLFIYLFFFMYGIFFSFALFLFLLSVLCIVQWKD